MGIKSLSVPLVCMVLIAMIPAAMAVHTIEGGTGSTSNAGGATVVGEVYSNRYTEPGVYDAYELGIQAIIDQTGIGTSSVQWQTGSLVSRTVTLNASDSTATSGPSYTGVFSLGADSTVSAVVAKTNTLGTGHAEARIRTAANVTGVDEMVEASVLNGMAEITATASYTGLGSGTANASASGNASYSVKENKNKLAVSPYGGIPIQVWGAVSGTTTSSVSSAAGGSASGSSAIRAGSYATNETATTGLGLNITGQSGAGYNNNYVINTTNVTMNEVVSSSSVERNYNGAGTANSFATSGFAESGAWDASVNQANPRTKEATESVYSTVEGTTIARSAGYLGGDEADNVAGVGSMIFHNSANTTVPGASPLYTSNDTFSVDDPETNGFMTYASGQRVTPGTDSNKVTSEAFLANGAFAVSGRDELPTTTVARLLQMSASGAQFGSGSHLVNQATGTLDSMAGAGFGASYVVGIENNIDGLPVRDNLTTTHIFGVQVAGPGLTGNINDDAGSYGQWGTEAGSSASTQFMSRPNVANYNDPSDPTQGVYWDNAYASMTTSIAGENAVGWLSGDDARIHMEAQGSLQPVVSSPSYSLTPTADMIFTDMTAAVQQGHFEGADYRYQYLVRPNAGAQFEPANYIV